MYAAGILATAGIILLIVRYRNLLQQQRSDAAALRGSELLFRNAFQEASVGMVILDVDGKVHSVNRGFADLLQYSAEELVGTSLFRYIAPEYHGDVAGNRGSVLSGKLRNYRAERRFIRRDGHPVWVRTSVSMLQIHGERHTIALVEDITERKQIGEELKQQALRDSLTGLPNRRDFEEVLDQALAAAKADSGRRAEVALLYVDLDGFKLVNDTLGHRFGDLLLMEVSTRLKACLRERDLLARVGGDEFTIVLTGLEGSYVPEEAAKSLLTSLSAPFQIDDHQISISASVGISRYPFDGNDSSVLLQNADAAMYSAKRTGNNRYQFFTSQMRRDAHQRLTIENHLRRALANGEISVQYQPQYELATGRLVRFEALCRWSNRDLGAVAPDRFVAVAEETGLIHPIGSFVLRESCRQALEWQYEGSPVQVAVNVSAVQFARADFVQSVVEILNETGLKPSLLELELTESALIRDREEGVRRMARLKKLGVCISIDDFGTGYSSLSYLQNMPVDSLKIDRSFTARLGSSQTALTMVRAMIAMARALGLRIVTEGVENEVQVEILRQLGSDEVQGFYYSAPEDGPATVERVRQALTPDVQDALFLGDLVAIGAAATNSAAIARKVSLPSSARQLP